MTDSFPRQQARTRRFSLGAPRSFQISPDGATVAFLRSRGGSDPVTCLWALDVGTGTERLAADPARLSGARGEDDALEKARRERAREQASGIVGFAADRELTVAAFTLAGHVYLADLRGGDAGAGRSGPRAAGSPSGNGPGTGGSGSPGGSGPGAGGSGVRELATRTPAADPRPDPAGRRVAYACDGALRVIDVGTGEDRAIADPAIADPAAAGSAAAGTGAAGISFGLAEFVAAEEMERTRGYWWAPDGTAVLVTRVDENPVQRWHIADPASPAAPAREVRYPSAGTANAEVTVLIASLAGQLRAVTWDGLAFPYLVTACWAGTASRPRPPLLVVQSRDQRELQLLEVDPGTGQTTVLRADTDPHWVDIVPGVPAWTADGRIAWTADSGGARRLVLGTAAEHAAGAAEPVTPPGLQVRQVMDADGDTILFTASADDPAEVGLWLAGPDGVTPVTPTRGEGAGGGQNSGEPGSGMPGSGMPGSGMPGSGMPGSGMPGSGMPGSGMPGSGMLAGRRAGGTTVVSSQYLDSAAATVTVLRDGQDGKAARITSLAERPDLPQPRPILSYSGSRRIRTAILLPSWHKPGSAGLPVLCDPYGGPHAQRVLAAGSAFLTSQWLAEQGFAVVIADGRGTPGRGPDWDRAVAGDLAGPVLDDQVEAVRAAAEQCADLDLSRVAIRGWSFGGYLAALAVLRRPDVFHAAVAGAPVTDWRLYDTHYTERYLGLPDENPGSYERTSLLADAGRLTRPLMLIHGLADDNVVVAHSLRLSSALLAAGRPHTVLPLTGVTHMASQEEVAENLLLLQVDFLRRALDHGALDHGAPDHGAPDHGAPDHGAPDHGAPDHGAPDHGAPDHGGAKPRGR